MTAFRVTIAIIVTAVWAVVYLATVFNPNVHAPPELSGVMLGVVTWLFGSEFRKAQRARQRLKKAADALLSNDDDTKGTQGETQEA